MLKPVWNEGVKNGWKNNNADSGNHIMKLVIDWKPQNFLDLVISLQELVQQQQMEVESALAGQGVFTLTETYLQYQVDPQVWTSKTREQRVKLVNNFISKRRPASKPARILPTSSDQKL